MDNFISTKEASNKLGVCIRKIHIMMDSGILKGTRTRDGQGRKRLIPESEIINFTKREVTRICNVCKKELSVEEFHDKNYKRMFHTCKKCHTRIIHIRQIEKLRKKYETPIKTCEFCENNNKCYVCVTEYKISNGINDIHPERLRAYLIFIRGHKCERCNKTHWEKELIPLDTHHIDGNRKNNKLENLKLLCKNCHALTDNYCFKNGRRRIL